MTTIAWRLGHLTVGVFGVRAASHFGGPPVAYTSFAYTSFDYTSFAYTSFAHTSFAHTSFAYEGTAREAIHHGAEISLLRDHYHNR